MKIEGLKELPIKGDLVFWGANEKIERLLKSWGRKTNRNVEFVEDRFKSKSKGKIIPIYELPFEKETIYVIG